MSFPHCVMRGQARASRRLYELHVAQCLRSSSTRPKVGAGKLTTRHHSAVNPPPPPPAVSQQLRRDACREISENKEREGGNDMNAYLNTFISSSCTRPDLDSSSPPRRSP